MPASVELLIRGNAVEEIIPFYKQECKLESTKVKLHPSPPHCSRLFCLQIHNYMYQYTGPVELSSRQMHEREGPFWPLQIWSKKQPIAGLGALIVEYGSREGGEQSSLLSVCGGSSFKHSFEELTLQVTIPNVFFKSPSPQPLRKNCDKVSATDFRWEAWFRNLCKPVGLVQHW